MRLWSVELGRSIRSPYVYVPLLATVALLQATVAPRLSMLGAKPNFMLLTVVAWGLLQGARQGVIWGFVGGLCLSFFSGAPFAAASLVLMAVGALAGLGQMNVYRSRIVLPLLTALVASLIHGLLWLGLLYVAGRSVAPLDMTLRVLVPSTVLNSLLMIPSYELARQLQSRSARETMQW